VIGYGREGDPLFVGPHGRTGPRSTDLGDQVCRQGMTLRRPVYGS
jgi:hypothetical protein